MGIAMNLIKDLPLIIWGFLVGFVGWGSCLRLGQPVGDWLIPINKADSLAKGLVRLLVISFMIFAIVVALALLPAVLAAHGPIENRSGVWHRMYGITFVSSFAGWFAFGLIYRVRGKR